MNEALAQRVRAAFADAFGPGEPELFFAPGRVNLIGEHTDYNDGYVLPVPIALGTMVAARETSERRLDVYAADLGERDNIALDCPIEPLGQSWRNYVRGVAALLGRRGFALRGAQLAIAGDVPIGSGLSSSASLEMAVARALSSLSGLAIPPRELALVAQRAEQEFAGCACGIMDQLTAAEGVAGHAMLLDCRSLEVEQIPLPDGIAVVIVDSGFRHANSTGGYGDRRAECIAAARALGVATLREADPQQLARAVGQIDPVHYRRARHILTENQRVLAVASALKEGNLEAIGACFDASHASMRDDFEITLPAIDDLQAAIQHFLGGRGGARMTGGGFGGCVVALCDEKDRIGLGEYVRAHYRTPSGEPPSVYDTIVRRAGAEEVQ